jgi:hypothetical protein
MEIRTDLTDITDTRSLLTRMVEAIAAAETQTPWPAKELAELADEVFGDGGPTRVWALT